MKKAIFILAFISLFSVPLFAQEFSADIVSTAEGVTINGKIYVAKDKMRIEIPGGVTIARMDKDVVWVLIPSQNIYLEQPVDERSLAASAEKIQGEISREFIKKENIGNALAGKYRVSFQHGGVAGEVFVWMDDSLQIPVKTEAVDKSWSMEYRNISRMPQPPSLFEVPAGYKKFSIPTLEDIKNLAFPKKE